MSLLTLPPFLTRRKETVEPDLAEPNAVMRFLTQGGATVTVTGSGRHSENHHWKCLGCGDTDNGIGRYDWDARNEANAHAVNFRCMPKAGL